MIQMIKIFLFSLSLIILSPAMAEEYGSVIKDRVELRQGPSTTSAKMWDVFQGFPVKILQRKDNWCKIEDFEGDTGWIFCSYISDKKTAIVKNQSANVKKGPGEEFEILAKVKKGVVFDVLGRNKEWFKLNYKGLYVWSFKENIWPEKFDDIIEVNEFYFKNPITYKKQTEELKKFTGNANALMAVEYQHWYKKTTIYVWIKNIANYPYHVNPNDFTLIGNDSRSYHYSESERIMVDLQPGTITEGVLVFNTTSIPKELVFSNNAAGRITRKFPY